jgi:hypothetical protein
MKKQTKQIVLWSVIIIIGILVILVVKNWDAFINGFNVGESIA